MTTRRSYSGAASAQTLSADMTSVAATASLTASTGWPNGVQGPFAVVIDRGTNSEEKVLCSSLSGNTLTIQTRGYDGTGAVTHSAPATVELCLTAVDLDEANAHTSAVAGVHGISGAVVGTTDIQTLANKTLTTPTVTDWGNANHDHSTSSQGGLLGTALANFIHTGSQAVNPNNSFIVINHGALFTPTTGCATITGNSPAGNTNAEVYGINSTSMIVAFRQQGSAANISLTSCTISYAVFA